MQGSDKLPTRGLKERSRSHPIALLVQFGNIASVNHEAEVLLEGLVRDLFRGHSFGEKLKGSLLKGSFDKRVRTTGKPPPPPT